MNQSPINPNDIVIAVVGVTGAGKSTFINYFTNEAVEIGTALESCTQEIRAFQCSLPGIPKFWLIDTPGFDDSNRSDAEVLRSLSRKLAESYAEGIMLSGIIYLHRIMDVRFGGAAGRQLRMFKRLCGDDNLDSVVLATTFWQNVAPDVGKAREEQLRTDPKFWAPLIEHNSKVFRQDREKHSGEEIIRYLVRRKERVVLLVQRELVSERKTFAETSAGEEVLGEQREMRMKYEKEIENLKLDMQRALAQRDQYWMNELGDAVQTYEGYIARDQKAVGSLRRRWDEAWDELRYRCTVM